MSLVITRPSLLKTAAVLGSAYLASRARQAYDTAFMPKIKSRPRRLGAKSVGVLARTRRRLTYNAGRALYRQPKSELKCFDVAEQSSTFRTAVLSGSFHNIVVLGTEIYNRIGRKIYMKSLLIDGHVTNIANGGQAKGRIIVGYDAQPNAAGIALADVLQNCNAAAATTGFSQININNRQRFRILRDQPINLPAAVNATIATGQQQPNNDATISSNLVKMWIPLNMLETIFNSTNGGTIADINSGSLFLFCITSASDQAWTFTYNTRLRFYD